jgi:histidyl-tRNA synthetase
MRRANKLGATFVLIVGDHELKNGTAVLRNLEKKKQEDVPLEHLIAVVCDCIKAEKHEKGV